MRMGMLVGAFVVLAAFPSSAGAAANGRFMHKAEARRAIPLWVEPGGTIRVGACERLSKRVVTCTLSVTDTGVFPGDDAVTTIEWYIRARWVGPDRVRLSSPGWEPSTVRMPRPN